MLLGVDDGTQTYKLNELAHEAGVSVRTVRYYVQRGLLQAPPFRGSDTVYTQAHLRRLKAIRLLQQRHFPLDAILAELERAGDRGVDAIVRGEAHDAQVPAPFQPSTASMQGFASWRRIELVPGVELHVRDDVLQSERDFIQQVVDRAALGRRGTQGGNE